MELSSIPHDARGSIDEIDFVDGLPGLVRHIAPLVVPMGAPLRIRGWALDAGRLRCGIEVRLELGGQSVTWACMDERPDIAAAFGAPHLADCGFTVGVPTRGLAPGQYNLKASVRFAEEKNHCFHVFSEQLISIAAEHTRGVPIAEALKGSPREIVGSIDSVEDVGRGRLAELGSDFAVRSRSALIVRGWAFHPTQPISALRVRLGSFAVIAGAYLQTRLDVAASLRRDAAASAGFVVPLRLGDMPLGHHRLSVECEVGGFWLALPGSCAVRILRIPEDFPLAARLLGEPLPAKLRVTPATFESSAALQIDGTLGTDPIGDVYLEIFAADQAADSPVALRRFPLDFPMDSGPEPAFSLRLPAKTFRPGRYTARIVATTPDRRAYRAAPLISIDVIAPRDLKR